MGTIIVGLWADTMLRIGGTDCHTSLR